MLRALDFLQYAPNPQLSILVRLNLAKLAEAAGDTKLQHNALIDLLQILDKHHSDPSLPIAAAQLRLRARCSQFFGMFFQ